MPPKTQPVAGAAVDEHIFPASILTPLALKWKELTAAGKHKEAMLVLEQLVIGSTAMFERLAMYENYHHTVDLSILVAAAQQKLVVWTDRWEPKKGRLFSWYSKSLTGDSTILLADGTTKRLDEIVNKRLALDVVTWDEAAKKFTTKPITGWSVQPTVREGWRMVSVTHPSGFKRKLYATFDHEFQTQRGWVMVDDLKDDDTLYMRSEQLTEEGKQAILGMYLGDGHINTKHCMMVGHSAKQRFYVEHLASMFGKQVYDGSVVVKGKTHATCGCLIPLRSAWKECKSLPAVKQINKYVLENLGPIALAYWFMDDGSYDRSHYSVRLSTESFTPEDCQKLIDCLRNKFGIESSFHYRKDKNYGYIYVTAKGREAFFSAISPYVLPLFAYKMPDGWVPGSQWMKFVSHEKVACKFARRSIIGKTNIRNRPSDTGKSWFTPDFSLKYDITVADTENFIAEGIVVHNCSKNAFRSELGKVNQFRKRFHVTSDNLEQFYGAEDHDVDKHDLAKEVKSKLADITCRWGDPQEIGAIRYLIDCIIEEGHDKQAAIRGASYAFGLSFDMARFFYNWAVVALRHAFYEKVYIPFTEKDLEIAAESYTFWPEVCDIIGTAKARELCVKLGGARIKVPSMAQLCKTVENYRMALEIERSGLDPDTVAELARKHKRTPKAAAEIWREMTDIRDPRRMGEYEVYGDSNLFRDP